MAPIEHISTEVHTENGDTIVVTATRPGEFVVCKDVYKRQLLYYFSDVTGLSRCSAYGEET